MSKKVIRRRGTTVAAAALSVALVAPVVQPVVSVAREPEGVNLTCVDRGQPFTPWDAKFTPDTAQWVSGAARTAEKRDAIEVGYINSSTDFTNAKSTISGWVHLAGTGTVTNGTGEAVAEGTPVYMQWRSATGAISPVYVTYTHNNVGGAQASPGTYAFDLREGFFDSNGQYHVYEAYNDQFYRVWTEPGVNGDPQNGGTGSIIYPVRFGNGIVPRWANSMGAGRATGQFQLVGVNVQRVDIKMGELPIDPVTGVNYMRAGGKNGPLVETPAGTQPKFGGNFVSGRVWREGGRGADSINLITGPAYATGSNHGDSALEGYKVYLTTLTEEGRAQITNIQDGATETDKVRAVRDALKANPEYLEKTYVGTTDAQGNYAIHVDVPAYAKNFDDYTQNVYMWVEDPHGVIVQAHTRFARPVFTNAAGPSNWSPIPTPAALSGLKYANNFAVTGYPQDSNLNMYVKDYDETLHQAKRGATAELVIDGALPPVETRVVWVKTGERDANGKTVATSQVVNPDGSQKMSSGTRPRAITDPYHSEAGTKLDTCGDLSDTAKFGLKVPDTAEDGDIYTAMLFVGDEVRAADSFAVSAGESARYDVTYDRVSKADAPNPGDNGKQTADSTVGGVDVKVGNVVSGKPKVTDDQNPGTTTDQLPDGAKLGPVSAQRGTSLDRWKENFRNDRGFEYDDIQFTDDGRVVLPAVPYGKQDEILKLPVVVTYQDGTKDLLEIEVETEEKLANKLQPRYDEKRVHKGDDNVAIEAPKFFDADGKPVAAKPVAKFELNPGSRRDRQLPDGWNARDITVDPNTGAITITKVPAGAKPGLNQIPVLVTYYQDEAAKAAGTEDSHEIAYVPVYILGTADDFEPRFGDVRKEKGQDFSSEAPTFHDPATGEVKDLPADAKPKFELKTNDGQDFNIAPGNDELRDKWNLKIDPATGVVTGTIPDDAEVVNGIHPIPVKVTYADGTVDDVFFNLFVGKPTTVENTTTDPDGKVVVDPSKITPVDSNGEEQPTGVTIVNPDADTKVTATDGDGKPVEVRVTDPNADGKSEVVVTPGEDVKGPITIVIKDPDLKSPTNPNGEVTAVVPVNPAVVGENTNVPADGKEHPVGTVTNPKGGETGKLVDGNGTKIPGSKVEIDDQGKIKVTVPAGTDPKDATVVVNDKGGNKIGELPVKITKPAVVGENTNVPADGKEHPVGTVTDPKGGETGKLVDGNGTKIPGSKVEIDDQGKIKVTVPAGTDPKDATVVVNDKGGNKIGELPVKITKPAVVGENTNVPADGKEHPVGTVTDPKGGETGKLVDGNGTKIPGSKVEIDDQGKIKVTVPAGTDPKDATVVVNDKGGNKIGELPVKITKPAVVGENTNVPADGKEHPVGTVTDPKGGETGKLVDGNGTKIPGSKVEIDDQGKIKVTVPAGTDPKDATVVVNDKGGNKIGELPVKITKPETDKTGITVNPIKPGDTVIEGKGPANGSVTVTVTDKDGKEKFKETKTTDGNGNWKVTVPGGVAVGDTVTVESNGNTETIKVVREGLSSQLEGATKDGVSKKDMCVGSLIGMGVPLALLVPVGLALAAGLPALRPVIDQVSFQIQSANTALQQQLGIFNPDMARAIAQVDLQLKEARISLGQVAFGLALLAAGLTAVGVVASNCSPNEKTGSSGFAKLSPKSTRTSTTKKTTETKPSTSKTSTSATTTKSTTASTSTSTATSTTPAATTAPTATETQ